MTDKNELFRRMLRQARANGVPFHTVLGDTWFASEKNMEMIHGELRQTFVFGLKANRLAIRHGEERRAKAWTGIGELGLEEGVATKVWLKGLEFPAAILRHIHRNMDGSEAVIYLCTNDLSLTGEQILNSYQKRWAVEEYHKSIKQNTALKRAPLWSVRSLLNHVWASLCAYVKLEALSLSKELNQFALKAKIRFAAQQAALQAYLKLSSA